MYREYTVININEVSLKEYMYLTKYNAKVIDYDTYEFLNDSIVIM